jgi:probable O-glycosylation ligase (exosortase A-associated)
VYGIAYGQQFNLIIAAATLLGWLISAERKRWTPDLMPKLMLVLVLWMTLNSWFAVFPEYSWEYWNQTVRTLALVFLVFFVANTKARIHGLVWIVVLSLGYYGVKGGIFTILTGGQFHVFGPDGSILADNNQLAVAVVMTLPLVNYLRMHTKLRALQLSLTAAIFLEIVTVLGSQSRGAAVALAATFCMFCLTTGRKIIAYALAGTVLLAVALSLMPGAYFDRLHTINDAGGDSSFAGRLAAWHVATDIAIDRFPFGAGFYAPQRPEIFRKYEPAEIPHAAHSIYFQILGEHGFVGLSLYVLILLLALRNTGVIKRQTRDRPELLWAYDLANMIRIALVGFFVGGAALSMAYFDAYLLLIAVLSTLREVTAARPLPRPILLPTVAPAFIGGYPPRPVTASLDRRLNH